MNLDDNNPNEFILWYKQPAKQWIEALPVGNGRLGAMVFGGVSEELIQLNEDTLWAGFKRDTNNHSAREHLEEVRELLSNGEYVKAQEIIQNSMLGPFTQPYLPLGNLRLKFEHQNHIKEYNRILNLNKGVVKIKYKCDGSCFTREVFSSAIDQTIVLHFECDNPGNISFSLSLDSILKCETVITNDCLIELIGKCPVMYILGTCILLRMIIL